MPREVALKGYYFRANDDGAVAIQADEPYAGVVTIVWKPAAWPGKSVEFNLPQDMFLACAKAFVADLTTPKK